MKLQKITEAGYAGAYKQTFFIVFEGEGDRGGSDISIVGPFATKAKADKYILRFNQTEAGDWYDTYIQTNHSPEDWMNTIYTQGE